MSVIYFGVSIVAAVLVVMLFDYMIKAKEPTFNLFFKKPVKSIEDKKGKGLKTKSKTPVAGMGSKEGKKNVTATKQDKPTVSHPRAKNTIRHRLMD